MDLKESTLSSEPVYDGVLLHVRRDEVRLPDGGTSVREWIEHPGASAVVPVHADGSITLLRQFRYPPRREFLEVPAGKFDEEGESAVDLARRELREEAGVEAARWTHLGKTYPGIGYSDEVIHLFLAEDLTEVEAGSDDDEFVEPVRMPFAEAVRMARAGDILDAKSCVAILLAEAELARRDTASGA
ncbi:MAG: NUDIX hydrolase [Bacteroidota bacterium]